MKAYLMFVLGMGISMAALAEPSEEASPMGDAGQLLSGTMPELLRMAWENNSCEDSKWVKECWRPADFREGDRISIREIPRPAANADGPRLVALSFVQNNGRYLNTFFGVIDDGGQTIADDEHSQTSMGPLLVIHYLDDPPNEDRRALKTLSVQQIRGRSVPASDRDCELYLQRQSNGYLKEEAVRVCNSQLYPDLLHWKIVTRCEIDPDSGQCRVDADGKVVFLVPPNDGQGTGSGND